MRLILLALTLATPLQAAPCGGDFNAFLNTMQAEAVAAGTPTDGHPGPTQRLEGSGRCQ